jgi:hypothetical protein
MHLFLILRNGSCVAKPANIVNFESSDDEEEFADGGRIASRRLARGTVGGSEGKIGTTAMRFGSGFLTDGDNSSSMTALSSVSSKFVSCQATHSAEVIEIGDEKQTVQR